MALYCGKSGLRPGLLSRQLISHGAPSSPQRRIMSTKNEGAADGKPRSEEVHETPYWTSALSSFGIWNGGKPSGTQSGKEAVEEANALKSNSSADHLTTPFHGQSFRRYPQGCPRPKVHWFHAVDVRILYEPSLFNADTAIGAKEDHVATLRSKRPQRTQTTSEAKEIFCIFCRGLSEDRSSVPKPHGSRRGATQ